MAKKLIFILVIIIGAVWAYMALRPEPLALERAAKMELTEISLEGRVLSVGSGEAVIEASRVERREEGNVVISYEQKVSVPPNALASAALRAGDRVVFYGPGESLGQEVFAASRVSVITRASTSTPPLPSGAPPLPLD